MSYISLQNVLPRLSVPFKSLLLNTLSDFGEDNRLIGLYSQIQEWILFFSLFEEPIIVPFEKLGAMAFLVF